MKNRISHGDTDDFQSSDCPSMGLAGLEIRLGMTTGSYRSPRSDEHRSSVTRGIIDKSTPQVESSPDARSHVPI